MIFTFHCRELTETLTGLGKVLAKRASLPVLKHIRIDGGGGQPVCLHATDLDQHLSYTLPDTLSDKPAACLILPHKELLKLTRSGKDDSITLQLSDTPDTARIKLEGDLGVREHFLPTLDPEEWPEAPEALTVQEADGRLLELYRNLLPFASSDESRTVITGICIEPHAQGHTMAATDGRRLCTRSVLVLPDDLSGILPPSKFLEWSKLPDQCRIGFKEREYRIETGCWSIQGKLIDGTYPNWRQVVPDIQKEDQLLKLADDDVPVLEDAVKTLPTGNLTGREAQEAAIHIIARNDVPVLASCDGQGNWTYRELPNSSITPGDGTSLNRRYLLQAVKAGFRVWRFRDELHPLQSLDDGDQHVIMPMRRENAPPEVAERKSQTPQIKPETTTEQKPEEKGKVITMPNPNEHINETEPADLLELAQSARDQAKDLNRTLSDLVRRVKAENRANKALQTELGNAKGVLEKLRDIAA
jgi:DNA polymerase-3 subunit beta